MCSTVRWDGAVRLTDRLLAAHGLSPVQRLLPHQGPEGRHRGVSAGCLWVRLELKLILSLWFVLTFGIWSV